MALDQVVVGLLEGYHSNKGIKTSFDRDMSDVNVAARRGIKLPSGDPAYGASPGLAGELLGRQIDSNITSLASSFSDEAAYRGFESEIYGGLQPDAKDPIKMAAYTSLVQNNEKIRLSLNGLALKRLAAKHKLDDKIRAKDASFDSKSDDEKLQMYASEVGSDEKLAIELSNDASLKVSQYLEMVDKLNTLLNQGKKDEAINYASKVTGSRLASLLRNEGMVYQGEILARDIVKTKSSEAAKLMKDNGYVVKDIESALGKLPNGYARAAGEVYSVIKSS